MGKFRTSDDEVFDYNFGDVLDVLGGPSRWQPYLGFNLKTVRHSLSKWTFRVERQENFNDAGKKLGFDLPAGAGGVTDKMSSTILLRAVEPKSAASFLLAALHECVHLVSDPISQCANGSSAQHFLKSGLLEGLVEAVTEDVLSDQKIPLPMHLKGYETLLPVARQLIQDVGSIDPLGALLFQGYSTGFLARMQFIYGDANWEAIKNLAAIEFIGKNKSRNWGSEAKKRMKQSREGRKVEIAKSWSTYKSYSVPGHHALPWALAKRR